ncbi:MAG: hypothetical protein EXS31_02425 [Pedosphaera sp.]|nr:hypothetical protein [Pedosphaera sp.]
MMRRPRSAMSRASPSAVESYFTNSPAKRTLRWHDSRSDANSLKHVKTLMIGNSLTHYRITAKLGEGGMGAVYRATDTKLGREVAIKVLPPHFSRDAQSLARFEREASALASLNHPQIAAIYGFDSDHSSCSNSSRARLSENDSGAERFRSTRR